MWHWYSRVGGLGLLRIFSGRSRGLGLVWDWFGQFGLGFRLIYLFWGFRVGLGLACLV